MKCEDYRAKMTPADFDAIPVDEDNPLDEYYVALIDGNKRFSGIDEEYPQGYEDIELIKQLTKGQQLLILLGVFDGQVKNGGITQFFWNYPGYIFAVRDAIEYLGETRLLKNYEKALEKLAGEKKQWFKLREECYKTKGQPSWETFQQSYGLLELSWFDDSYFDETGYDSTGQWTKLKRGLHLPFQMRLVEYIKSHKDEFIKE
jgi:hypothetical protein